MDLSLEKKLITTKDASELSGYTSDYITRLVRRGEILGERVGNNWLIDNGSFGIFLDKQKNRKIDRTRELARERAREYRSYRQTSDRTMKGLTEKTPVPEIDIAYVPLRSHLLALSVAVAVVVSGATLARADTLSQLAGVTAILAQETASGFNETFGNIPANVASKIASVARDTRAISLNVAQVTRNSSEHLASPLLSEPNLSSLQIAFVDNENMLIVPHRKNNIAVAASAEAPFLVGETTQSLARSGYDLLVNPSHAVSALSDAYSALGERVYTATLASLSGYRTLVEWSGMKTFTLAVTARDTLATAPRRISNMNLAFGNSIIKVSHAAIRADVSTAYLLAAAAPASARASTMLALDIGNTLTIATGKVPGLASTVFAVPATLAPRIAQSIFGAEYYVATRFVAVTNGVTGHYIALIDGVGNSVYAGTKNALALAQETQSVIASAPATLEDVSLGALGKGALAIDSVSRIQPIAAAIVAAKPALSVGQKAALTTYHTIHDFFDSTTSTLAVLFTPAPILVDNTVKHSVLDKTPSTHTPPAGVVHENSNYTTIVQGVSSDFVNQSMSGLRSDILSNIAGMLRPISTQGSTNATTIQQVNMIQDLTGLTVHNGNFIGGTFSGGTLSNGVSVSATNGNFTNLTAGVTTLATTTISGTLTVSGASSLLIGTLDGPLQANGGVVSATSSIGVVYGGTGLTIAPTYGQLLLGNSVGGYTLTATSSLGINSGVWGAITGTLSNQTDLQSALGAKLSLVDWYATSTTALLEGNNLYWTNTRFDNRLSATTTLPNITTLAGLSSIGNFSGIIAGNAGNLYQVSTSTLNIGGTAGNITGIVAIVNGGTASSTPLGGILVGNGLSAIKSLAIGTNLTFDGTTLNAAGGSGT
ncbi:MAG: hypothetical protein WAW90_00390, partial [Minisyncoccia bacterium]